MNYPRDSLPLGFESLLSRRSVRSFSPREVDPALRSAIVQAGAQAPSAHGSRPVRFWILDDSEIRHRLIQAFPWYHPMAEANFTVFVLGKPSVCVQPEYWTVDAAAATENLLSAGELFGLGSVWLGIAPVEENLRRVKELLEFPDGVEPFSLVAMGYPAQGKDRQPAPLHDLTTLLVEGHLR